MLSAGCARLEWKFEMSKEHHYIVEFTEEELLKAKKIRTERDRKWKGRAKEIFVSENSWTGVLGEWAVKGAYPDLEPITQHYNPTKFDFQSPKNGLLYEVKTKCGRYEFEDYFDFDLNDRQYRENNNDIYISCYHVLGSNSVSIVGWLRKDDLESLGKLLRKGQLFKGRFPVKYDRWSVPFSKLEVMYNLPS